MKFFVGAEEKQSTFFQTSLLPRPEVTNQLQTSALKNKN